MADDEKGLKDLFIQYCNYGKKGGSETEIDNVKFFKLCKGKRQWNVFIGGVHNNARQRQSYCPRRLSAAP